MSFTWRMEVKDETFTNLRDHPSVGQDYITPDAGVASLDEFSVDGAGNCLEASFRASPKFVDIRARDIVSLEVSEDDGSTWMPVYRGYVVTAGNPRSDDIQSYKLVGLRQRFFEITNNMTHTTGEIDGPNDSLLSKDVSVHANEIFAEIDEQDDWPAGVVNAIPNVPDFGFLLGVRYPQGESYGDTLKAIADSAGRFVVPVGETYTFDGKTYNELETVPATRFGVDGAGNVFFTRPKLDDVEYSEVSTNVIANYTQVTGEEIFDVIELEYLSEVPDQKLNGGVYLNFIGGSGSIAIEVTDAAFRPLRRKFTFGSNKSRRIVRTAAPEAFMSSDIEVVDNGGSPDPEDCFSGGVTELPSSFVGYASKTITTDGALVKVKIRGTSSSSELRIYLGISSLLGTGFGLPTHLFYSDTEYGTNDRQFILPLLPIGNITGTPGTLRPHNTDFEAIGSRVTFAGTDLEISNLEILIPDVDLGGTKSEQFASGFVRDVQEDVAEVTLVNQLGPVAPRMVWTPEGESSVTVPVERIQYSLTRNDGLITRYELGQAFDAELLSERAVLKGLAREAVSE